MGSLEGRKVLVTGGSSGIGLACARGIAAAGGSVAVLARRGEVLARVAEEIGGLAVPADVTDHDGLAGAVERAVSELGGLDALVNAAGLIRPGGVEETDPADARLMFEVNVLGLVDATHLALPHLRASGAGDVVNISSMSGRRVPSARHGLYCGTKFAVHAISEGLRLGMPREAELVEFALLPTDERDA